MVTVLMEIIRLKFGKFRYPWIEHIYHCFIYSTRNTVLDKQFVNKNDWTNTNRFIFTKEKSQVKEEN